MTDINFIVLELWLTGTTIYHDISHNYAASKILCRVWTESPYFMSNKGNDYFRPQLLTMPKSASFRFE